MNNSERYLKDNKNICLNSTGIFALCMGLSLSLSSVAANAQEGTDNGQEGAFVLEEITVTARKRAEGLQDAPISISAFTESGIEQRQIQVISDIAPFTPSLTFENASTNFRQQFLLPLCLSAVWVR